MTHKKSELKEKGSYYYEYKPWYEACPETLPEIPAPKVEILPRAMTNREILKEYSITPYRSYAEAAAAMVSLISTLKYPSRIVYFKEDEVLYHFIAWRYVDGQLLVRVREVDLDDECDAELGVAFSNGNLDTSEKTLDSSESSTLASAIKMVTDAGYTVECGTCGAKK